MSRTSRPPLDPERRRGLARVPAVNVGVAVLGSVATVGVAVGLASARTSAVTPGPRVTVPPAAVPAGTVTTPGTGAAGTGTGVPAAPASAAPTRHHRHVSAGTGGGPTAAQSHGS